MTGKVLLLALGDDYWTRFTLDMVEALRKHGIEAVVAADSRVGEYQCFGHRLREDKQQKSYYFSDFIRQSVQSSDSNGDDISIESVFSDFYRLKHLGAQGKLRRIDWVLMKTQMATFFENLFDNENIRVVVHDQVSTSFSYVCWLVAKKRGIPYLGLVGARIPDRYEIRRTIYGEADAIQQIYKDIVAGARPLTPEERAWADKYLVEIDQQQPSYMKDNFLNKVGVATYANWDKLRSFLRKVRYQLMEYSEAVNLPAREPPITTSIRSFVRNAHRHLKRYMLRNFGEDLPLEWFKNHEYYVYPIHYQPEASTSVGSPYFVDQLNFITNVAFSLPPNAYLVVKDHISAFGYFPIDFYRNIRALPNVKFLGPNWNIKNIIRDSRGVITLTSTAGFEAVLLQKPVYIFGRASYDYHPLCRRVGSWQELKEALSDRCQPAEVFDNSAYLVAYRRYTREGIINYKHKGWGISDDLVRYIRDEFFCGAATSESLKEHGQRETVRTKAN